MTRSTLVRRSLVAAAGAAAISAVAVGTAFADGNRGPGMMRGRNGGHPIFALLCMVAIAGAAILGTWLVIRRRPQAAFAAATPAFVPAAAAPSPTVAAEAILAERLARSEISPDDYRSMLAALRETTVSNAAAAPSAPVARVTPSAPVTAEDAS